MGRYKNNKDGTLTKIAGAGSGGSTEDIEAIVNVYGSKNLLPYPYAETTKTVKNVTFTDNNDGTITTNGTSSGDIWYTLRDGFYLKNGRYILSGCPQTSAETGHYYLYLTYKDVNNTQVSIENSNTGGNATFTINGSYGDTDGASCILYIYVINGAALSDNLFQPMIRDARISDNTYAPYAMTNKELTDKKTNRDDITTLQLSGATNTSGSTIATGRYFYLNSNLVRAKTDIANGATFTLGTNYENTSINGALNNDLVIDLGYIYNNRDSGQDIIAEAIRREISYQPFSAIGQMDYGADGAAVALFIGTLVGNSYGSLIGCCYKHPDQPRSSVRAYSYFNGTLHVYELTQQEITL